MDKVTNQNLKCTKHSNKDFYFVQINDVLSQSSSNKPLFYCPTCVDDDFEFKTINFILIDKIIQEADSKIIPKWPPINDYRIIQDLSEFNSKQFQCDYIKQITDFFNQFKEEFLAKIDNIQKMMINEALKYPTDRQQIIERYQEISKIQQFKQLLNKNNNQEMRSIEEYSTLCREFISQIESQKDKNTELLQDLLSQANYLEKNFSLNLPNIIKQQIFACVDNISFFKNDLSQDMGEKNSESYLKTGINNQNNNRGQKMSAELIMKLVSNKSNFCSNQFLHELDLILQKLNYFLQQYNFNIVHRENKEAIDFSKISDEKLNQIEDYVKHQILLTTQQSYENEVKNSLEIKQINLVTNSKMSFLNNQFLLKFEKCLIDVKPFLKDINFSNIFNDQNQFDFYGNLKDEYVRLIYQDNLFKQKFQLLTTQYNDGQKNCYINKKENCEYEIYQLNGDKWLNCISNTNLQKDLKYIFRIQVENIKENDQFMIGLMRETNSNKIEGCNDYLSSYFLFQNQFLVKMTTNQLYHGYGINTKLKVQDFKVSKANIIELRVCLKDQILEVVDYPNYQYKLGLDNQYKQNLTKNEDLRFYIGIYNQGFKIVLKEVQIVNEFKN